ncbi:hypothetical protein AB0A77_15885 [Streptomyces varsoviensis]|uniref:hypothetical protein n=1 Tax=Streptomyces varsoviensis TaxID=67373 RepID=UPI0033E88777
MTATNHTNATGRTGATDGTGGARHTGATGRAKKNTVRAAAAGGALAGLLLGFAPAAHAAETPTPPAAPAASAVAEAHRAATAPATLDTLSRFFARDSAAGGAKAKAAGGAPAARVEGATVPVYTLAPEFVAGKAKAPVAKLDFLATKAVSADGRKASVWAVRQGGSYKVVNIATGDDETRYVAAGAEKASGGTVFREPQIDAWYVQRGDRVLPLDADAERAVGARGISVAAYQARVHKAYGDKLPGSEYAKKGLAGGYDAKADSAAAAGAPSVAQAATTGHGNDGLLTATSLATGGAAVVALGLSVVAAKRRRRA